MIAIPIVGKDKEEMLASLEKAERKADIVELRLDNLEKKDLDYLKSVLNEIVTKKTKPLIVTLRSKQEGGDFPNKEKEQIIIYEEALKLKVEYIDVEMGWGKKLYKKLHKIKGETKIITSYHNFKKTLSDYGLREITRRINRTNPDIFKIACMANSTEDNLRILNLIPLIKRRYDKPIMAICMGEKGTISRVMQESIGGFLTFVCLDKKNSSAPGQINYNEYQLIKEQLNL